MADRTLARILGLLAFAVPFTLYALTAAPCVGFDDAAEFAYVAAHWSIAHPPGFPVWVALAHFWSLAFSWLDLVRALHLLSATFGAGAVLLVYAANARILGALEPSLAPRRGTWAAFLAAMGAAAGATVWQWSNAIEVYAFQGFCTALLLYAIALDPRPRAGRKGFVLAGLAAGLGFANHSLTTLLLLPFAIVMAWTIWRTDDPVGGAKGFRPLRDRRLLLSAGTAVAVFVIANAVMMLRARGQYEFEFGNPDTLPRLWHHLKGGFYSQGLFHAEADFGGRMWFLLGIVLQHFWLSAVFLVPGVIALLRTRPVLALAAPGYLAALMVVQAERRMVANTDCYLIPALLCCSLLVAIGLARWWRERPTLLLGLAAVLAGAGWNFHACDRSGYDAGDAWIQDLDASAPPRSVILFTNWDQQILAAFYRDCRNFRPDLIVLSYDVKWTNHECARLAHPAFVAALQPEYDAFLEAVAAVDPDYVFTDFAVQSQALANAHAKLVHKVFQVAASEGRSVLMDRATRNYLGKSQVVKADQVHPCGILFALGRQRDPPPFRMSGRWWQQPFLMYDLCAAAVLRDYQDNARQITAYWKAHGDAARERQAAEVSARVNDVAEAYRAGKTFLGW